MTYFSGEVSDDRNAVHHGVLVRSKVVGAVALLLKAAVVLVRDEESAEARNVPNLLCSAIGHIGPEGQRAQGLALEVTKQRAGVVHERKVCS